MTTRRGLQSILLLVLALLTACNSQSPATPEVSPNTSDVAVASVIAPVETPAVAVIQSTAPASTDSAVAPAATTVAETPTPATTFDPGVGDIDGTAEQDAVFAVRQDAQDRQPVPWLQTFYLGLGDGVAVDKQGWATLRYKDLWTMKVYRDGELTIDSVIGDRTNLAAQVLLRVGALLNDVDPAKVDNLELRVDGDLAKVLAVNAPVAVVEEESGNLGWAINLSSVVPAGTVEVIANGVSTFALPGTGVWAAPVGPPSQPITINLALVQQWFSNLENGIPQPEIGEILLQPANVEANVCAQQPLLQPNQPFDLDGIVVTLASESVYGPASYTAEDCNNDGLRDIAMRNGSLRMDFRGLPARVRALDVPLVNRGGTSEGFLAVLDPAVQEMERKAPAAQPGQEQLLSLRSEPGYPYHYADLTLKDGCFLGASLTPPQADGTAGAPRRPAMESFPIPGAQCQLASGVAMPPRTHLRTGPGTAYPPASSLVERGDVLMPLAQNPEGDWLKMEAANGQDGWLPVTFLDCVEVRCLPVVKPPPPPSPTATEVPTPRPAPTATPQTPTVSPTEPPHCFVERRSCDGDYCEDVRICPGDPGYSE